MDYCYLNTIPDSVEFGETFHYFTDSTSTFEKELLPMRRLLLFCLCVFLKHILWMKIRRFRGHLRKERKVCKRKKFMPREEGDG